MGETKINKIREKVIESFFLICAFVAVISVLAITFYVFYNGLMPFIQGSYPIWDFISGVEWRPGSNMFGIFYMIVGSIFSTFGAILLGVPIAILTAVFISQMASGRMGKIIRFAVELLAGIPSVLYWYLWFRNHRSLRFKNFANGSGGIAAGNDSGFKQS